MQTCASLDPIIAEKFWTPVQKYFQGILTVHKSSVGCSGSAGEGCVDQPARGVWISRRGGCGSAGEGAVAQPARGVWLSRRGECGSADEGGVDQPTRGCGSAGEGGVDQPVRALCSLWVTASAKHMKCEGNTVMFPGRVVLKI